MRHEKNRQGPRVEYERIPTQGRSRQDPWSEISESIGGGGALPGPVPLYTALRFFFGLLRSPQSAQRCEKSRYSSWFCSVIYRIAHLFWTTAGRRKAPRDVREVDALPSPVWSGYAASRERSFFHNKLGEHRNGRSAGYNGASWQVLALF